MTEARLAPPNRRFHGWLGLGFLAFVIYGSWVPFTFVSLPPEQAIEQFKKVLAGPIRLESRSDWVANILLMLPAAYCLMGALGADRPRGGWIGDLVLVLPVCLCVSVLAEFGQLFLPGRVSSLNDIVAQGIGAVLGAILWGMVGQPVTMWGRQFWQGRDASAVESRLLPAYLVMLAVVYLVPLDLTLSPAQIYHKFQDGRVNLVPFLFSGNDPYSYLQKTILNVIYFAVLGLLLPGLVGRRWRADTPRFSGTVGKAASFASGQTAKLAASPTVPACCAMPRQGGWLLAFVFLFVCLLNGLKILVASRNFDVTDVLLECIAALAGWRARLYLHDRASAGPTSPSKLVWRVSLLGIWLVLLAFVTWQPFDFDLNLAWPRLEALSLLPFADLRTGEELVALQNVVEKLMLYVPLGMLLTTWKPSTAQLVWLPALVGGFLIALGFEAGQLVLVSRTASLSDVYVETAGAVLGSLIARRMVAPAMTAPLGSWC